MKNGIALNAVTEINPNAMEVARKLDKERALNKKSNLYSIPVIVMVGYDEKDTMTEKRKIKIELIK